MKKLKERIIKRYESIIKKLYQRIRQKEEFLLSTKEVIVKKGKKRYTLLFFESVASFIRINLGRRGENIPIEKWI